MQRQRSSRSVGKAKVSSPQRASTRTKSASSSAMALVSVGSSISSAPSRSSASTSTRASSSYTRSLTSPSSVKSHTSIAHRRTVHASSISNSSPSFDMSMNLKSKRFFSQSSAEESVLEQNVAADEQAAKVDKILEMNEIPLVPISDDEFRVKFQEAGLKFEPETLDVSKFSLTPKPMQIPDAIRVARAWSTKTYDQNLYLSLNLGLDPRKPNQMVRGIAPVPHGSGQKVVLAVFAVGEKAAEAKAAGADIVGGEDLIAQVQAGKIDFTRCVATPDMMRHLSKVARILGPRGLMPNPKIGTVTNDIAQAIHNSKQGQIEFRCDRKGVVHAIVGKASWPVSMIEENIVAFIRAIDAAKPSGAKGVYFKSAFVGCDGAMSSPLDTRVAPFRS